MSRSISRIRAGARRRVLVAVGIGLATAAAASGCAAGQIAATAEVVPAVQGSSGTVGSIAVRDVKLEYPQGGRYQQGQNARLTLVMVNSGPRDDALTAVRTDSAGSVVFQTAGPGASASATASATATASASGSASPSGSAPASPSASGTAGGAPGPGSVESIPLPPNQSVLGYADGPRITLVGLTESLRPSASVRITFSFRSAGNLTLVVAVAVPTSAVPQPPAIDVSPTAQD